MLVERAIFDDLLDANARYRNAHDGSLPPGAARRLAVVTCIDSRIDPLAVLGLALGEAKILRNAGGRVTDDVLRSLILAVHLLGVDRVFLLQHTGCAVMGASGPDLRARVEEASGEDASDWDFLGESDQAAAVRADVALIRSCPLLPDGLTVGGFILDLDSGTVRHVDGAG